MEKKNAFTLIELLAVIVILAIIALIAVPVIMNVINKANKSAFKDTAYGIISAGELYFAEQQLELNGMSSDAEFVFPTEEIQVKGNVPAGTVLKVNTKGETALSMSNGRYCVTKGYSDKDITITEEFTDCNIPSGEEMGIKTFSELTTTEHACTAKGQICKPGETLFAINVNNSQVYDFYVLNDDGETVNLIMSENFGEDTAWITSDKYKALGGSVTCELCAEYEHREYIDNDGDGVIEAEDGDTDELHTWTECGDFSDGYIKTYEVCSESEDMSTFGPLTALEVLKERTSNWTNIAKYSYTLNYGPAVDAEWNQVEGIYSGEYVQNVRAKLPKLSDFGATGSGFGCRAYDSCDDLVTKGGHFWFSDASDMLPNSAFDTSSTPNGDGYVASRSGVRPVITLTK